MAAVTNSNLELVGVLISHGANVNCSGVCYRGRVEEAEYTHHHLLVRTFMNLAVHRKPFPLLL